MGIDLFLLITDKKLDMLINQCDSELSAVGDDAIIEIVHRLGILQGVQLAKQVVNMSQEQFEVVIMGKPTVMSEMLAEINKEKL